MLAIYQKELKNCGLCVENKSNGGATVIHYWWKHGNAKNEKQINKLNEKCSLIPWGFIKKANFKDVPLV